MRSRTACVLITACIVCMIGRASSAETAADWPRWRGARDNGSNEQGTYPRRCQARDAPHRSSRISTFTSPLRSTLRMPSSPSTHPASPSGRPNSAPSAPAKTATALAAIPPPPPMAKASSSISKAAASPPSIPPATFCGRQIFSSATAATRSTGITAPRLCSPKKMSSSP